MTHIETIRTLTKQADNARTTASIQRTKARAARDDAAEAERFADAADLRAIAYEDSIDALQRLSVSEATA